MRKGFSVTEMLIVMAMLGIALAVIVPYCSKAGNRVGGDLPTPEHQAREFFAKMYPGVDVPTTCVDMDTNGDSYVTCTGKTPDGLVSIECASLFSLNSGCKIPNRTIFQ